MDDHLADPAPSAATRLAALARYDILDTEPEAGFDDIVVLASRLCAAPLALVSLVADDRQWFKARLGLTLGQTPISQSVCAHALTQSDLLVIPDLTLDARTSANPLVTGDPWLRFYAGAVLETPDGVAIGTLCVLDTMPRPTGLSRQQREGLQALARQVIAQLELRRALRDRDAAIAGLRSADEAFRQAQSMLTSELQHRLKNLLAIVQAILLQTLREGVSMKAAREASLGRIAALASCQDLLFTQDLANVPLDTLLRTTTAPLETSADRIAFQGPPIEVSGRNAVSLALLIHELATNAMKYGALSNASGQVSIDWRERMTDGEAWLNLSWREQGGPPVVAPSHAGFGTRLIRKVVTGAIVDVRYEVGGLTCRLEIPVRRLREA